MLSMRWFPVILLAYIVIGIQAGISGEVRVHGFGPNLPLLVVVFVALSAPRESALLACVLIGAMQDLATQQSPGLFALSYGLVAWLIVGMQNVVYREHPLTHTTLALVGGLVTGFVIWIHGRLPMVPRVSITLLLGTAIYTAVLATPVLWAMQRSRRAFGMKMQRGSRRAF
jgi:rod shape-determining protein MreD